MSNSDATSLLRALSAGIRPDGASTARPAPTTGSVSFTSLLASATSAQTPSTRPVETEPGVILDLTQTQLDRLASIIDSAEAQGSTRLAVLHEGNVLHIDVLTRTVESIEPFDPYRVFTEIDSIANLDEPTDAEPRALTSAEALARSAAGSLGIRNESLANLLDTIAGAIDPQQNDQTARNQTGAA